MTPVSDEHSVESLYDNIFADPAHAETFKRDGFVKIRIFEPEEAAALRQEVSPLISTDSPEGVDLQSINLTTVHSQPERKRKIAEWVERRVLYRCLPAIPDYKVSQTGVAIKPAGFVPLEPHIGWSMMDDDRIPGVTAWVALEDVDESKGAMKFLKGSHGVGLAPYGPRIPPIIEGGFGPLEPHLGVYTAKAGEAFFFHSYILHGSTANTTDEARLAVRFQFLPKTQRQVIHRLSPEDPRTIDVLTMSPEDLDNHTHKQITSADLMTQYLYSYPLRNFTLTPDEFMEAMSEADALRSGLKTLESFKKAKADTTPRAEMNFNRFKQSIRGRLRRLRPGSTQSVSCDTHP